MCSLHWLARVMLPGELSGLNLDKLAFERETGAGTLADVRTELDRLSDAVCETAHGRDLYHAAFFAADEPTPRTGVRKALAPILNAIQTARALRFVMDGTAQSLLDRPRRRAPVAISETYSDEEYVNPRFKR